MALLRPGFIKTSVHCVSVGEVWLEAWSIHVIQYVQEYEQAIRDCATYNTRNIGRTENSLYRNVTTRVWG